MDKLSGNRAARWRARSTETAASLDPASRHYLRDLKRRRVDEETFESCRIERWRLKNGLEHRALTALLHAPEELPYARGSISPADFLTPAYAGLAAVILDAKQGAEEVKRARAAIVGRPYLPSLQGFDWAAEARETVSRLAERREKWTREQLEHRRNPVEDRE